MARTKDEVKIPLRRIEVEKMMRQQMKDAEIAEALNISLPTLQRDKKAIKKRMIESIEDYKEETDKLILDILSDANVARGAAWEIFYRDNNSTTLKVVLDAIDKQINSLQKLGVIEQTTSEVKMEHSLSEVITIEDLKGGLTALKKRRDKESDP